MRIRKLLIGIALVLVGVWIVWYGFNLGDDNNLQDVEQTSLTVGESTMVNQESPSSSSISNDSPLEYSQEGNLMDISDSGASGVARAGFDNETYFLEAEILNLPALDDGYFYEGWVVERDSGAFISTGELDNEEGSTFTNVFSTDEKDFSDYNFYVLTLEPDDGDPAPAKHIIEGELTQI